MVEDERVEGDVDRALDGVLDRDEADADRSVGDGMEDIGDRAEGDQLHRGVVGLGQQCLLAERALRSEERDAATGFSMVNGGCHERQG